MKNNIFWFFIGAKVKIITSNLKLDSFKLLNMLLFFYILLSCVLNIASSILIRICKTMSSSDSHEINKITKQNKSVLDFRQITLDNNKKMSVQGEKENNDSSSLTRNKGEPSIVNKIAIYKLRKQVQFKKKF